MRFIVLQHIAVEHPGAFRALMKEAGIGWDTVELDRGDAIPDLEPYDAMLVLGGPMDVWQEDQHPWLTSEKAAIRAFVAGFRRPFLGLCLGHQLLADALGGEVGPMRTPEVGVLEVQRTAKGAQDPIFSALPDSFACVQWHGAQVAAVPEGAQVLARNAACAVQAFRWGKHAYGAQFHVEIEEDTIATWGKVVAYRQALEQVGGADAQANFEAAAQAHGVALWSLGRALFTGFVQQVQTSRGALSRTA